MGDQQHVELAYVRAKYASRCELCGDKYGQGTLIARPIEVDDVPAEDVIPTGGSRPARWSHASCAQAVQKGLTLNQIEGANRAYRRREQARRRRLL